MDRRFFLKASGLALLGAATAPALASFGTSKDAPNNHYKPTTLTTLEEGLDHIILSPNGNPHTQDIHVLTYDPKHFLTKYSSAHLGDSPAQSIQNWQKELSAVALLNGPQTTGGQVQGHLTHVIAQGQESGPNHHRSFASYFVSDTQNGASEIAILKKPSQALTANEYDFAVQSWPILISDSKNVYSPKNPSNISERSAVAILENGRGAFIKSTSGMSYETFAQALNSSDLGIESALAMGSSLESQLYIPQNSAHQNFSNSSHKDLVSVLSLHKRP